MRSLARYLNSSSLCGAALVLYAALWLATASGLGVGIDGLVVFSPFQASAGPVAAAAQIALAALGVALVFFVPGALALMALDRLPARLRPVPAAAERSGVGTASLAFLLSLAVGALGVTAVRALDLDLGGARGPWLAASAAAGLALLGLGLARRPADAAPRSDRDALTLALGFLVVLVLVIALRNHLAIQNFSDDEQETIEFARSLQTWARPHWTVGAGWGFYPVFMLFAYPVYCLTVVLGESEFVVRLLYFASLFVVYATGAGLAETLAARKLRLSEHLLLGLGLAVITTVAAFYNSWHPYITGLAEPSGVDMFGFALFLAAAYWLFQRRDLVFFAAALLFHTALPNGTIYTLTLLGLSFLFWPGERLRMVRLGLAYVICIVGYHLAHRALFGGGENQFSFDQLARYFADAGDVRDLGVFLVMILVLSGGTAVLAAANLWRPPDPRIKVLTFFLFAQLAFGLVFTNLRHVHYHLPALFLAYLLGVLALQRLPQRTRVVVGSAAAAAAVLVLVVLVPRHIGAETNARALGQATQLDCTVADLAAIYRNAESFEEIVSWRREGVSMHNWIYYAQTAPKAGRLEAIIADNAAPTPPGFRESGRGTDCKLLVRDDFDRSRFAPRHSYRDEPAWRLLAVQRWKDQFNHPGEPD